MVSFGSKHIYSSVTKDGFSFGEDGDSKKRVTEAGIDSYFSAHEEVLLKSDGSNDAFTFSIYPSR